METIETKIDEKIKYFLHLPAHIKRTAVALGEPRHGRAALNNVSFKECDYSDFDKPAHVVNGSITAIHGRINIPDINKISRLYEISELPPLIFN